jgi:O-antigen/teichoic acid export membrane protein
MTVPVVEEEIAPSRALSLGSVGRGLSWNTFAQVIAVVANLLLTPLLLHRFPDSYQLLAFAATLSVTFTMLDGGIGAATTRFVAVHTGAGELDRISRLLVTVTTALVVIGGAVCLLLAVAAGGVVGLLHQVTPSVHGQAVTTVRLVGPMVLVALLRGGFTSVLAVAGRWGAINAVTIGTQFGYLAWTVGCLAAHTGVVLIVLGLVVQQSVAVLCTGWLARKAFRRAALRLLPRAELADFGRYAFATQINNLSALVNLEADAWIIGLILPFRDLTPYAVGAGLAAQIRALPLNGLSPLQAMLGTRLGQDGPDALRAQFATVQRLWVRAVVPLAAVAAATALPAVPVWTGGGVKADAGVVAAVLLLGHAVNLATGPLTVYCQTIGRPGLETRYGIVGMVLNLALTVPLALAWGLRGVVVATAVSQVVGSLYFAWVVRKALQPAVRSFLSEMPLVPVAVGAPLALLGAWLVSRVSPGGAGGLVLCGLPGVVVLTAVLGFSLPEYGRRALAPVGARLPGGLRAGA